MTARSFGAVVIGSGNIGTDLMFKVDRLSSSLDVIAMVGIDPDSDGLARAAKLGHATTSRGIEGLSDIPGFADCRVLFDATSAGAHQSHAAFAERHGKVMIDLTPAAIGPYVVPSVNLDETHFVDNVNMVTCGGQATIPIVAAVASVARVAYAEIVASISSRSAGPGTRANIDEFTETTGRAIEVVGGAEVGKAIIILNPADPPIVMRDTVYCLIERDVHGDIDTAAVERSVRLAEERVRSYVPGYVLKQDVQFDDIVDCYIPALGRRVSGLRVAVYLEVSGAGHYLPEYAGNLDIMTSAALQTAERMLAIREEVRA